MGANQCRLRPPTPIPPEASTIHGIQSCDVTSAPTFSQIYHELVAYVAGKQILAYNVSFDRAMINHACRENYLPLLKAYGATWVDVMEPHSQWLGDWSTSYQNYHWQPLPRMASELHGALRDCQAVFDLLHRLAQYPATEQVPSPACCNGTMGLPMDRTTGTSSSSWSPRTCNGAMGLPMDETTPKRNLTRKTSSCNGAMGFPMDETHQSAQHRR